MLGIAGAGISVSLGAAWLAEIDDARRLENAFLQRSEWLARDFQDKLEDAVAPLESTALFIGAQAWFDRSDFDRIADNARAIRPLIRNILWVPRIVGAQRAALEADERRPGRAPFVVSDWDETGRFSPAPPRAEHMPVLYERLYEFQGSLIGADLAAAGPLARAAQRARDRGHPSATRPYLLPNAPADASGIVVFVPVYNDGRVPIDVNDRRMSVRGHVAGALHFEGFLREAMTGLMHAGDYLVIATAPAADSGIVAGQSTKPLPVAVFTGLAGAVISIDEAEQIARLDGFRTTRTFESLGRQWDLLYVRSTDAIARDRGDHPRTWLSGGLVLTLLVCLFAWRQRALQHAAEAAVAARTDDLRQARQSLATTEIGRARAEQDKRRTALMLQAIVDNALDGIVTIDPMGRVLTYNPGAARMFGYTAEEVVGRNVGMLMPEPDKSRHDGYVRRYVETGERRIIGIGREVRGRRKDGTEFPVDLAVSEMRADHRPVFIGTMRDLTERKQLEAQLAHVQRMEAIGQLSGGIAHDFNNMLGAIMGNLELAAGERTRIERIHRLIAAALRVTGRAGDLVQRILAFSRRQILHPVRVDVAESLADILPMLRRTLGEQIEVHGRPVTGLWPILVDPAQFESAILNLAINARDAMPDGGALTIDARNVTADVALMRLYPDLKEGPYVRIDIADTGAGIPADLLQRVFEPFYTTKEAGRGTGLGLSMVYGFLRQSGGTAKIYSEVGQGTTVQLYFPRAPADDAAVAPAAGAPDDVSPAGGGERILLVEDNADVIEVATDILEDLGYRVAAARDGREALSILERDQAFDLMLSDIVMPVMNGIDLAREVARRFPAIRILMTSGYANPVEVRIQAQELGYEVLQKPYRRAALAAAIRAALDEAR